jgi:hypothetical protein
LSPSPSSWGQAARSHPYRRRGRLRGSGVSCQHSPWEYSRVCRQRAERPACGTPACARKRASFACGRSAATARTRCAGLRPGGAVLKDARCVAKTRMQVWHHSAPQADDTDASTSSGLVHVRQSGRASRATLSQRVVDIRRRASRLAPAWLPRDRPGLPTHRSLQRLRR